MVSPDVSGLSPLSGTRRQFLHVNSSSPDLPPLREVLATQNHSQPRSQNGGRTTILPMNGTPDFVSARHLYSPESTSNVSSAPLLGTSITASNFNAAADSANESLANGGFIAGDSAASNQQEDDIVVVKITGKSSRKPRQQKVSKPAAPKRTKSIPSTKSKSSKDDCGDKDIDDTQVKSKAKKKRTGTMSNHFPPAEEPEKLAQDDVNEPLHLEQAPARRLDWTPPAQKTVVNIDSDSSAFKKLGSSEADQPLPVFKNLVGGYACTEESSESACRTAPASDEDSSFLKKRKRIELLATKGESSSVVEPEKSPTKKPPKKKKPRTITELATAAYRVPSQPDPEPPSASILDHFSTTKNGTSAAADAQPNNPKGKGKQRRKTTKAPKKKAPPKPVLLSPSAALAQVANQDFVFGTSSQLAREESPTVLRDLQAALRQSNQNDDIDFAIPIHSDGIEPQQQRSKLWDAAARDAEGDLFDVEVINLTDTSLLQEEGANANPFGYHVGGDESIIMIDSHAPSDPDPNVEVTEALALPGERAMHASEGGSPYFSDSDLSASTNIGPPGPEQSNVTDETLVTPTDEIEKLPELPPQPPRPNYEGFTDLRLAKEIKRFGFKPIKRRSAMIALLDRCWQSKARMGQASFHATATPSAGSKTIKATKTKTSPKAAKIPKKSRGQSRRNSPSASEPQEPPPSAQPPETPKRRPGRPRKDSLSSSPGIASPSKRKSASPSKRNTTSSRRGKASQTSVIEIPDSEDNGSDFASSPQSNLQQTFSSPAPLDMSITTNDGTESILAVTQTEEDVALFEHITNAVRSAPRTTDPQEPSWNEKILLYEPIILEDFATWLNTGELSRVGYDGEVNPNDVKKWCESKSVCCVARISLRGKERRRF